MSATVQVDIVVATTEIINTLGYPSFIFTSQNECAMTTVPAYGIVSSIAPAKDDMRWIAARDTPALLTIGAMMGTAIACPVTLPPHSMHMMHMVTISSTYGLTCIVDSVLTIASNAGVLWTTFEKPMTAHMLIVGGSEVRQPFVTVAFISRLGKYFMNMSEAMVQVIARERFISSWAKSKSPTSTIMGMSVIIRFGLAVTSSKSLSFGPGSKCPPRFMSRVMSIFTRTVIAMISTTAPIIPGMGADHEVVPSICIGITFPG